MEITKDVHLLQSTNGSYVYLVLGEEPILIDTSLPGRATAILTELQTLGLKPTDLAHILLTHHDVDHIGSARALQQATGAKLWVFEAGAPLSASPAVGEGRIVIGSQDGKLYCFGA